MENLQGEKKYKEKIIFAVLWVIVIGGIIAEGMYFSYNPSSVLGEDFGNIATENIFLRFGLSFINCFKVIGSDSHVEVAEVWKSCDSTIISIWYAVANVLGPILALGTILTLLYKTGFYAIINTLHSLRYFSHGRIIVIGNPDYAIQIIKNNPKYKVVYTPDRLLSPEEKLNIRKNGGHIRNLLNTDGLKKPSGRTACFFSFLCNKIYICYQEDYKNIEQYLALRDFLTNSRKEYILQNVIVLNTHNDAAYLWYNQESQPDIINVNEYAAFGVVSELLKNVDTGKKDIHGVIVGFDTIGQEIISSAINLCTLSKDSQMVFDVISDNVNEEMMGFLRRFNKDVVELVKKCEDEYYCLKICGRNAVFGSIDGELLLRFWINEYGKSISNSIILNVCSKNDIDFVINNNYSDFADIRGVFTKNIILQHGLSIHEPLYVNRTNLGFCIGNELIKNLESLDEYNAEKNISKKYHEAHTELEKSFKNWPDSKQDILAEMDDKVSVKWQTQYWKAYNIRGGYRVPNIKRKALGYDKQTFFDELSTNPEMQEVIATEHRRWCYGQLLRGYKYTDGKKNKILKMHPLIISYEELVKKGDDVTLKYDLIPYCIDGE